ncbi:hypothetical protein [Oscillatoria sp. HE19RPO]|uniref:hypothetical protein n=1 Tax=Oscillatoria sp. HE19RPO TaxID=2954806 RepID=UPI0020C52B51|nr:hypothetical protein [Oscillatoria sp. HE19RPO]
MGRGRPGGNPDFGKSLSFRTERNEPLSAPITIRVSERFRDRIKQDPNWAEKARQVLAEAFEIDYEPFPKPSEQSDL